MSLDDSSSLRIPAKCFLKPIGNIVARGLARKCADCGKPMISHIFEKYAGKSEADSNGHHYGL